jgi:cytosine/adenosine deaminase-related metal-dependent hydrolase
LIRYHAAWVLPIAEPPIRNGWLATEQGRIAAYGPRAAAPPRGGSGQASREIELGDAVILPGLVNAHTHLELSYLRDAVPPASEFVGWIRSVIAARREQPDPAAPAILDALDRAIVESTAAGTAVVGDISNTLVSFEPLTRSPLAAVVFYELLGFRTLDPEGLVDQARRRIASLAPAPRVRARLAAHAPYSVAPLVFKAIRNAAVRQSLFPWSVHLSESADEVEFMRTAGGPLRRLLEELGAWDPEWPPPGRSPVEFLEAGRCLDERVLVVHGVQMTPADLNLLASRGATVVTCPRSNGHTGAGAPPLEDFYASGARVAVGTDSLASAPDLSVFAELATMRALAPSVPASRLLASATIEGARALGFGDDYGTLEAGKAARLLAVEVPAGVDDVEEYLVTGVHPGQLRWIE